MFPDIPYVIPYRGVGIFSKERNFNEYGWKKVFARVSNAPYESRHFAVVAKLIIPKDAGVVCGITKCRASRAIVDGFYADDHEWTPSPDNKLSLRTAHSSRSPSFLYVVGSEVVPDSFDPDPTLTCSHGIHFFRSYEEAAAYDFM